MNWKRYLLTVVIAGAAGLCWAVSLVGVSPDKADHAVRLIRWSRLAVPLLVPFACGLFVKWWRYPSNIVYAIIISAMVAVDLMSDLRSYPEDLSVALQVFFPSCLLYFVLFTIAWLVGRIVRDFARDGSNNRTGVRQSP